MRKVDKIKHMQCRNKAKLKRIPQPGEPMMDATAETTTYILVNEIVLRFGLPHAIHSNQGPQYESVLFKQVCKEFGINKSRTTAYHSQGNGAAERSVRSMKEKIRTYIERAFD
ncbi:Pol polyprotein [Thelohanellus kitauei]|uniref:Pol polyprotein n=1 Tax=Thelohanellus kitauei TaxID=669202 RepID=A0A0C2MLR8_THEKT|nr:Pol polyprotein [Thelohanellus kitauei]